jgi:alkylhydroperoxidase family enzyme
MPQQHLDGAQLAAFDESGAFSASQKLALRLAVALTKTPAEVSDDLFAALRSEFSEPQLVELAAAIARENSRARLNRTFAIGSAGFTQGAFCVMPERGERPA